MAMECKHVDKCLYDCGPFKLKIVSARDCETPSRPYVKNSPVFIDIIIRNNSNTWLISGNMTVLQEAKNVKQKIKCFIWENGKWRINYIMSEINCKSMLLQLMLASTGVKFDRKNCMFLKGSYLFKELDVNAMHHLWASKWEYGKLLWRYELFNLQAGTYACKEFDAITEPA